MTRPRIAVVALVAIALGVAGVLWMQRSSPTEPAYAPFGAAGTRALYRVSWKTDATASLERATDALATKLELDGELQIDTFRDGRVIAVRWTALDRALGEALTQPLATPDALAAQLKQAETVVVLDERGQVMELGFSSATTPLARHVQRALVLELLAQVAAGPGGRDVVDTALGRARVTRVITGRTIATTRASYDELDAFPLGLDGATAEIDARGEVATETDGSIARVTSHEALSLEAGHGMISGFQSTTSITATLSSRVRDPSIVMPAYVPATVRAAPAGTYDRRASLERRSLGVTAETLHADVRSASLFPRAGSTQWIWRDAAYLELHPEAAAPLLASATSLGTKGLAAAFDIVVIAGTEAGQDALVAALKRPEAQTEEAFVVLVQRLAFLAKPRPSLVAFVAREHVRYAGTDRGRAAAYTLGALARNVAVDDPHTAQLIANDIVKDLGVAETAADRVALLAALGNAGLSSTATAVIAHAKDKDVAIRRAVASALRRMEGSPVVDALLALSVDPAPEVTTVALDSLLRKQLDDADWTLLSQHVAGGRIHADAHGPLVNALATRRGEGPQPDAVLGAMLASEHVSVDVKQRIEAAMSQ